MKKFLTITFITLLVLIGMSINVQAAEVTTWDGLVDELANGSDKEITVNGDIAITDTKTLNLNGKTLKLNKSLVVDEGNLTITGNGIISTDVVSPLIKVNTGSNLVLENGTYSSTKSAGVAVRIVGSTTTDGAPKTSVTVKENAKISANYGVFIAQNNKAAYGVEVNLHGTIEGITGNNGYNQGSMAITTNGYIKEPTIADADAAEINIYDTAKLIATEGTSNNMNNDDAPAIYAAGYAIWNIYGGHIEGSEALSIKGGEFYVSGGTLKATGKFNSDPTAYNNGSEATGSAISITENKSYAGNIVLEVYDATVTSANGYAVFETITDKAVQPAVDSLIIAGGNYSGAKGDVKVTTLTKFIEAGTFKTELNKDYLAEGVTVEKDSNGKYVAGTRYDVVIKETANGTVTASVEKAMEGEKVQLTLTPALDYELSKLTVLNDDNNEVKVVDGVFTMPAGGVTVIAEFTQIPVEPEQPGEPSEPETPVEPEEDLDYILPGLSEKENEEIKQTINSSIKEKNPELAEEISNALQNGEKVTIAVEINKLEKDNVKEEEKQMILQTVKENQTVHQYLDISVAVRTEDKLLGNVPHLTDKIKVFVDVPENLIKEGRKFFILKLHDGEVEQIDGELNGTRLEIEVDQFSTFALAYEDAKATVGGEGDADVIVPGGAIEQPKDEIEEQPKEEVKEETNTSNVPNTGDNIILFVLLAVIAIAGIVISKKVNTKRKH